MPPSTTKSSQLTWRAARIPSLETAAWPVLEEQKKMTLNERRRCAASDFATDNEQAALFIAHAYEIRTYLGSERPYGYGKTDPDVLATRILCFLTNL